MRKIEKWVADDETEFFTKRECEEHETTQRMLRAFEADHNDPTGVPLESIFAWVNRNFVVAFPMLKG